MTKKELKAGIKNILNTAGVEFSHKFYDEVKRRGINQTKGGATRQYVLLSSPKAEIQELYDLATSMYAQYLAKATKESINREKEIKVLVVDNDTKDTLKTMTTKMDINKMENWEQILRDQFEDEYTIVDIVRINQISKIEVYTILVTPKEDLTDVMVTSELLDVLRFYKYTLNFRNDHIDVYHNGYKLAEIIVEDCINDIWIEIPVGAYRYALRHNIDFESVVYYDTTKARLKHPDKISECICFINWSKFYYIEHDK